MRTVDSIILNSIAPVISNLQKLKINLEPLNTIITEISQLKYSKWDQEYIFNDNSWKTLNYLLIFSALSFCYWGEPKWVKLYHKNELGGSESLFFSLTESTRNKLDITTVEGISKLTFKEFSDSLLGINNTKIKYLKKRFFILKEIGKVLEQRYQGKIINLYIEMNYDASKIVLELSKRFNCFKDEYKFNNNKVCFYKKAQEVVTLTTELFDNKGIGRFNGLENLTASSDYKLPQILSSKNLIIYNHNLKTKIHNKDFIQDKTREVIEIRSATIYIVNELKQALQEKGINLQSYQISNLLWGFSQNKDILKTNYPRILSTII